ncbi:hypothetical protein J3F83DRAFT_741521 [Trichoderma novae-zelandiae]
MERYGRVFLGNLECLHGHVFLSLVVYCLVYLFFLNPGPWHGDEILIALLVLSPEGVCAPRYWVKMRMVGVMEMFGYLFVVTVYVGISGRSGVALPWNLSSQITAGEGSLRVIGVLEYT